MKKTATQVIYNYLDNSPACILSGWQLFDIVHEETGRNHYPTTIINTCRTYADITGAVFECIDHNKSKYKFVPGVAKMGDRPLIDYKMTLSKTPK